MQNIWVSACVLSLKGVGAANVTAHSKQYKPENRSEVGHICRDDHRNCSKAHFQCTLQAYCRELQQHSAVPQNSNCASDTALCQMTLEAFQFRAFCATYLPDQAGCKSYTRPHLKSPDLPLDRVRHIAVGLLSLSPCSYDRPCMAKPLA